MKTTSSYQPKKPALKKAKYSSLSNPPMTMYKQLTPEKKNIDTVVTSVGFPGVGSSGSWSAPILLNGIALGAGSSQRVGRACHLRSFLLRVTNINTGGNGMQSRILVVYDRQTNGVAPNAAFVLASASSSESPMNLEYNKRFVVLCDYLTNEPGMINNIIMSPAEYRKLNLTQNFLATGATVTDIADGAIWLLWTCNITDVANPRLQIHSRVRYTDI